MYRRVDLKERKEKTKENEYKEQTGSKKGKKN